MTTAAIHTRAAGAQVLDVDFADRVVTMIVAPYESPAVVEYQGQIWEEVFTFGAFDSLDGTDPQRIRVNREHDRACVVGKAVRFDTRDPRGLVADVRIAQTPLGDETLSLAAEDMLSASAGFGVYPSSGQILDRTRRIRRITRAFLDHVALVMQPAYAGAQVLAVRATPNLDAFRNDPLLAWAEMRIDPIFRWAKQRTAGKR